MSSDGTQVDPEIAELLGEIPRYQGLRILSEPFENIRGSSIAYRPGGGTRRTSNAEKHLLAAYREEVAWLLRRASVYAMSGAPGSSLVTFVGLERRLAVPSKNELQSEALYYDGCLSGQIATEEHTALRELLDFLPGGGAGGTRFAAAAVRLAPRTDNRICLAVAMRKEGRTTEAEGLLRDVVRGVPMALDRSIAWNNLGTIFATAGRFKEAQDAYRTASRAAENPVPAMCWLYNACQVGDLKDAREAAAHLDNLVRWDHGSVDEYLVLRRRWARADPFDVTAARIRDRVGSTSLRVIDD